MLLDDPGPWWTEAVETCAFELLSHVTRSDGYTIRWDSVPPDAAALLQARARLGGCTAGSNALLVRAVRLSTADRPDLVPYLDVLEQWST